MKYLRLMPPHPASQELMLRSTVACLITHLQPHCLMVQNGYRRSDNVRESLLTAQAFIIARTVPMKVNRPMQYGWLLTIHHLIRSHVLILRQHPER